MHINDKELMIVSTRGNNQEPFMPAPPTDETRQIIQIELGNVQLNNARNVLIARRRYGDLLVDKFLDRGTIHLRLLEILAPQIQSLQETYSKEAVDQAIRNTPTLWNPRKFMQALKREVHSEALQSLEAEASAIHELREKYGHNTVDQEIGRSLSFPPKVSSKDFLLSLERRLEISADVEISSEPEPTTALILAEDDRMKMVIPVEGDQNKALIAKEKRVAVPIWAIERLITRYGIDSVALMIQITPPIPNAKRYLKKLEGELQARALKKLDLGKLIEQYTKEAVLREIKEIDCYPPVISSSRFMLYLRQRLEYAVEKIANAKKRFGEVLVSKFTEGNQINFQALEAIESDLKALKKQYGAEVIDEVISTIPKPVRSAKHFLKFLDQKLTNAMEWQQTWLKDLEPQYGKELMGLAIPDEKTILTSAEQTALVWQLTNFTENSRSIKSLLGHYDQRAIRSVLKNEKTFRLTAVWAPIDKRAKEFKAQDERIAALSKRYGISAESLFNRSRLLSEGEMASVERKADLLSQEKRLKEEDRDFLASCAQMVGSTIEGIAEHEKFKTMADQVLKQVAEAPNKKRREAFQKNVGIGQGPEDEPLVKRNEILWNRLLSAEKLPLADRIQILRSMIKQMENAQNFAEYVRCNLIQLGYKKEEEINPVIESCFSSYSSGEVQMPKTASILIESVLERSAMSRKIAGYCVPLLHLDDIDGAFKKVDTALLKDAEEAQLDYEKHYHLLERFDVTTRILQRIRSEIRLLVMLSKSPEMGEKLTDSDAALWKLIKDTAEKKEESIPETIQKTLNRYQDELNNKAKEIEMLGSEIAKERTRARELPRIDAIHADGFRMRWLEALAQFAHSWNTNPDQEPDLKRLGDLLKAMKAKLDEMDDQSSSTFKDLMTFYFDALNSYTAALKEYVKDTKKFASIQPAILGLEGQIAALESKYPGVKASSKVEKPAEVPPLYSFFRDFYVVPLGGTDAIFKDGSQYKGKWAVIDLRKIRLKDGKPDEEQRQKIIDQITPQFLEEQLRDKGHYQAISFDFVEDKLTLQKDKEGPIRIFDEDPMVFISQKEKKDAGERQRLLRKSNETRKPDGSTWPKDELGDYARVTKQKEEARWSKPRQITASVDRQIAIQSSRLATKAVLTGESGRLLKNLEHLYEFLGDIQGDDIAKLERSYSQDPIFSDAMGLFVSKASRLKTKVEDRFRIPLLRSDLNPKSKKERDLEKAVMELVTVRKMYKDWMDAIDKFIERAEAEPKKWAENEIKWYVNRLKALRPELEKFVSRMPTVEGIEEEMKKEALACLIVCETTGVSKTLIKTMLEKQMEKRIGESLKALVDLLKTLTLHVWKPQLVDFSATLREKRNTALEKATTDLNIKDEFNRRVVGNFPQCMSKIVMSLKEICKYISENSPLHAEALESVVEAEKQRFITDVLRGQEKTDMVNRFNEKDFPAQFFSH